MIKTPRGTKDILPSEIHKWQYLEQAIKKVTNLFSYQELRTPIFEHLEVFSRSIGEQTDIVNKEMYVFEKKTNADSNKKQELFALRPEMTAALVRSAIEHNLSAQGQIQRLWYYGPFFRYERPQAGRYRQFHQFGAECLATPSPTADIEVINLAIRLIQELGINKYELLINSLGNKESRANYRKTLQSYLMDNIDNLSVTSKERADKNPLRVLDSKDKEDQEIIANAPKIKGSLDQESQDHISNVLETLDSLGVNYTVDEKLVRGLDYYSHTVFELRSTELGSQDSFGGGGRYNELFSQLGGKDVPAVGFAMGIERLIMILEKLDKFKQDDSYKGIYLVNACKEKPALIEKTLQKLRNKGLQATSDVLDRSLKAQFKDSGKRMSKWTIVIGDDELATEQYQIKNMESGEQIKVPFAELDSFEF
jgi:histidyl-tRNA synthetase